MVRLKHLACLVAIFAASLACSTSGLPAPQSNGLLDSNALATVVAGTAQAAAAETALAVKNTPLLPPTNRAIPASTATTAPQISTEGTTLVKQSDGSYIFTDYQGGYSIVVPSVWLAVRINEQEFMNAQISLANYDPLERALSLLQKDDPEEYRLVAIDTSSSDFQVGFVSNLLVRWVRNDTATLGQDVALLEKDLPKSSPPIMVTYANMETTSTHLPMGIIEASIKSTTTSKQTVTVYQKDILFKLKSGTLTIIISTAIQLKDKFIPGFDLMTDQIKMLP